jgi:hypothetical protein
MTEVEDEGGRKEVEDEGGKKCSEQRGRKKEEAWTQQASVRLRLLLR